MSRLLVACLLVLVAGCAGCVPRQRTQSAQPPDPVPTVSSVALALQPAPAAVALRVLPRIDREPTLRILLARGTQVRLRHGSQERVAVIHAGGWRWSEQAQDVEPVVTFAPHGLQVLAQAERAERWLEPQGAVDLRRVGEHLELCETVPLETYIAAVLPSEINPRWPAAVLAAQAIAIRSYAAARYLERLEQNWQLHWHFTVDMAYYGRAVLNPLSTAAVRDTSGLLLLVGDQPLQAVFHAASGGRTEDFAVFKPGVLAPDGRTAIAPAMPVVEDPFALSGAAGLGMVATHGQWKLDVALPELSRLLAAWSAAGQKRLRIGSVEAVSIEARHPSGRVATVLIRHALPGQGSRFDRLSAQDFRFAIGPTRLRSTWWDRCVIAAKAPGYLVIQGRGYGHGAGLSQVSAWEMARQGRSAKEIVQFFYPGARLERRY